MEPIFIVRGSEPVSGDAVRAWADLAEAAGYPPQAVAAARNFALEMDAWPKGTPVYRPERASITVQRPSLEEDDNG